MTSFNDQSFSQNSFSQNAFEFAGNVAAAQASSVGSSVVAATGVAIAAGAGSFKMREARWASYRRVDGKYIRQVAPGVYLRVEKDKPVAVVENRKAMDGLLKDDAVVSALDADEIIALKKFPIGAMRRTQEVATLAALGII